jgi:alpha-galactosidase/6-phospho-beta-glucosidase family protein
MIISNGTVKDIKIAYIGGGSRGWAWILMGDLASEKSLSGTVYLYDIDSKAAMANEVIGNNILKEYPDSAKWEYKAVHTLKEALTDADFVIISILPGTFDEMEADVTLPQEYGIYQPVGDTTGVGGIIRALRTVPMFKEIALGIKEYSPNAYVINYTNPMSVCIKALHSVFPEIKALGCCHGVFGAQIMLAAALKKYTGIEIGIHDMHVEVCGINHFTWITKAVYQGMDILPMYERLVNEHKSGYSECKEVDWMSKNIIFESANLVQFDMFDKFGAMPAIGDRHLAEFCPGSWYLKDLEQIADYKFHLTPVKWRKDDLKDRLERAAKLVSGEEKFTVTKSGELGTHIIKALAGIDVLRTNINLVNIGQMPQAPLGAVVETNAYISGLGFEPIISSTKLPDAVYAMVDRVIKLQEITVKAALNYDLDLAFQAFILDPLNRLDLAQSRELFDKMIKRTSKYLPKEYFGN